MGQVSRRDFATVVGVGPVVRDRERLPLRAEGEAHPMYAVSGCPQVSGTTFPSTSRRIIIGHVGTGAASFGGYTADKFELGINYALGPGIKMVGGGIYWNVSGPVNGSQGQSWALMLGMDLRF